MSQNKSMVVSEYRRKYQDVIGKSFLFLRPDKMEQYLKPTRAATPHQCALRKEAIEQGDYSYRCNENPLRLNPNGKARICIECAEQEGNGIAPEGFVILRIPTYEQLASKLNVKKVESHRRKLLKKEADKLLLDNKKVT